MACGDDFDRAAEARLRWRIEQGDVTECAWCERLDDEGDFVDGGPAHGGRVVYACGACLALIREDERQDEEALAERAALAAEGVAA